MKWICAAKPLVFAMVGLLVLGLLVTQPASAQLGSLGGLFNVINQAASSILNFMSGTMRSLLQGIQAAAQALQRFLGQLQNLWEQVVWPISEIQRAHALAQQIIATFRGL